MQVLSVAEVPAPDFDGTFVGVGLPDDPKGTTVWNMDYFKTYCLHRDVEDAVPYHRVLMVHP